MRRQKASLCGVLCLAVLPIGCTGSHTDSYFGMVTPEAGVCDPPHTASLIIHRNQVRFAPTQGVLVLSGSIANDGMINATTTLPDMNRKPTTYRLAAHLAGNQVSGLYITPRCRFMISLRRD